MVKLEKPIYRPIYQSLYILLVANIFLGLLLFQAGTRANDAVTSQVADNNTSEFYADNLIPVPEADVRTLAQMETVIPDIAESKDGYIAAIDGLEPALSVPTEPPPGHQPTAYQENADDFSGNEEYRYIVRYVDREVVKEVPVEKPVELREFTSLEELKAWLAEDDTNEFVYLFAGNDGICQQDDRYDCDDYAFQLQERAASSGFLISVTIINERGRPHMINLACILNDIYYIEPQSDRVWFYCNRD